MSEMDWSGMTYDEQRALLGLPDVRMEVRWMHMQIAGRAVCEAVTALWERLRPTFEQIQQVQQDYALATGDDA
jgi:hypothetical protein